MTVNSRPIKAWLQANPEAISLPLGGGTSVQMLPSYSMIGMCRLAQQAAFVADHGLLVVWDEDPTNLFHRAVGIEKELIDTLWTIEKTGNEPEPLEKRGEAPPKIGDRVVKREKPVETDLEAGQFTIRKRPVNILNAFYVALTIAAITASLAAGMRQVLRHVLINGDYRQVGLCTLVPIQIFFTLFFAQVIFGSLGQILGPIRHLEYNSRHYSGELPPRLPTGTHLPNVTIQCPVYKEGLHSVIKPTVRSIQAAMTTYERQGGHVNLFVNDDGLQLLGEAEKTARLKFYKDNNIGWVARPPHGHNDFQRRGKFKKASNMNYAIMISSKLEEIFENKASQEVDSKNCLLCAKNSDKQALEQAIAETGGVAWAGGDIHIGDYILLVDSDTRVPPDHLLDAVSEMEQSPDVGILQFTSAVMQVAHNYFENGIAFFTNMIYSAIKYTVANGDVSPFVGHNAILRWTAIQELSYRDSDGYDKIWSESHVSEDFDMSLRLQGKGYNIRLATWGGDGFKEGVSLTVYDELARWEKYAYGCNELLFNPIRLWPVCGPFTPLFRQFLRSAIPLPSKLTVLSYIGTYYAIASAWLLTSANFFIWGWYADQMDHYYINSWQVWFSILVVFTGLGNVALAFMRYRCKERDLFESLLENFKWVVMMAIFLGGLSMHLSAALLSHMFEIKMAWGATAKEVEDSNFFKELPKIFKKVCIPVLSFWLMLISLVEPFTDWLYHVIVQVLHDLLYPVLHWHGHVRSRPCALELDHH